MDSADTPLGTLGLLQEKQRRTNCAYVTLSGAQTSGGVLVDCHIPCCYCTTGDIYSLFTLSLDPHSQSQNKHFNGH